MIPLVGIISSQMAGGVLAIAAGCAGWAWAKDFRNPGLAAIAISIVIAASMIMMYRSFGRRPMVGVVLGFSWAIYYAYWRGFPKPLMLRRLFIAGIIASLVLTLYIVCPSAAPHGRMTNGRCSDHLVRSSTIRSIQPSPIAYSGRAMNGKS